MCLTSPFNPHGHTYVDFNTTRIWNMIRLIYVSKLGANALYIDMCNRVAFVNLLTLYPCKSPWVKNKLQKLVTLFIHLYNIYNPKGNRSLYLVTTVINIPNNVTCRYICMGQINCTFLCSEIVNGRMLSQLFWCNSMNMENWLRVTDEPVEFEK